ncbi:MAG: minor capsid protein [Mizugakiibacter sp.]|uniref:minor capsid protein n=1 Tax=Mizugakiibacter sp. TaxID=1972610 RepID=UPI00320CE67D
MKFQPFKFLDRIVARAKGNDMTNSVIVRAGKQLGPWQDMLGYVPRLVNPYFYEALREAIGPIDGAINRLVTLDGIIRVRGGNDALTQLIQNELLASIPVNDEEAGLQAFYASQSNELYEQGFAVGELVMDAKGRELIGLRVADSKGIVFHRNDRGVLETWYRPPTPKAAGRMDGSDQIETVLRNTVGLATTALIDGNYAQLADGSTIYVAYQPEADGPYGTAIMRSIEFVAQILLTIQNAQAQVWGRYGDPPLSLTYKTKNRALNADQLAKRRDLLASQLASVLDAKRKGNSADFVQAIGADDDIIINVIGAQGFELQIEMPARHMMEQILAKFGLPAWMLGMQWSTAERMADQQSEMVLQEARTRFERRKAGLNRLVATWLRGRGKTWKAGDWELYQELPSLADELKRAQADFLRAQTQMMLNGQQPVTGNGTSTRSVDVFHAKHDGSIDWFPGFRRRAARGHSHHKSGGDGGDGTDPGEPWAEGDPELPIIERTAVDGLLQLWDQLASETLAQLRLHESGAASFSFDAVASAEQLMNLNELFIAAAGAEDGPLLQQAYASWVRGLRNAASESGAEAAIEATRQTMRDTLRARAFTYVRDAAVRSYKDDIVDDLANGIYDGLNPIEVAARLRARFGVHDYDWERLARSEIASAQAAGKEAQYKAEGLTRYDFVTAADACPICTDIAARGPYTLGEGPMPMDSTHPHCRCTIVARPDSGASAADDTGP